MSHARNILHHDPLGLLVEDPADHRADVGVAHLREQVGLLQEVHLGLLVDSWLELLDRHRHRVAGIVQHGTEHRAERPGAGDRTLNHVGPGQLPRGFSRDRLDQLILAVGRRTDQLRLGRAGPIPIEEVLLNACQMS